MKKTFGAGTLALKVNYKYFHTCVYCVTHENGHFCSAVEEVGVESECVDAVM